MNSTHLTGSHKSILNLLLCFGAVMAVYWPSFYGTWIYDDMPVLVRNPDIQSWANFLKDSYPGRPLRELTYLLDYQIFGLDPWGYRIQNLLWHGFATWLLSCLLRALGVSSILALLGALLFSLHPLAVEVVAQTSHRKDSLALSFALLSLLAYIRGMKDSGRWLWIALAVFAMGVSLLAKQVTIGLPLLWAFYEKGWVPKERQLLCRLSPMALWGVPLIAGAGLFVWFYGGAGALYFKKAQLHMASTLGVYMQPGSYEPYILMMLKSWAFMLKRVFWPKELAVQYKYPLPEGWNDPYVLAALVMIAAMPALVLWAWRKQPLVLLGAAVFVLLWLPASGLVPLSYLSADRYMYGPLAGSAMMVVGGIIYIRGDNKSVRIAVTFVLMVFAMLSFQQVKVWKNERTLWNQSLKVSPTSTYALNNLGAFLIEERRPQEAIPYLERATMNFDNSLSFYNLGRAYEMVGRIQEAAAAYKNFMAFRKSQHMREYKNIRQRFLVRYGIQM